MLIRLSLYTLIDINESQIKKLGVGCRSWQYSPKYRKVTMSVLFRGGRELFQVKDVSQVRMRTVLDRALKRALKGTSPINFCTPYKRLAPISWLKLKLLMGGR